MAELVGFAHAVDRDDGVAGDLDGEGLGALGIVFGHHAVSGIQTDVKGEFERLLRAHKPNVIAYLYGHDHNHQICGDKRENQDEVCTQFWEVQTASLLEFPQEARRVKIKYAGKGMGFLEVVAFPREPREPRRRSRPRGRGPLPSSTVAAPLPT